MRDVRIAVYAWIALAAARKICRKAMSNREDAGRKQKIDVAKEKEKFWNSPAAQHWLSDAQRTVQTEIDRDILHRICQAQPKHPRIHMNSDKDDSVVSAILGAAAEIEKSTVRGKAVWAMLDEDYVRDYARKLE